MSFHCILFDYTWKTSIIYICEARGDELFAVCVWNSTCLGLCLHQRLALINTPLQCLASASAASPLLREMKIALYGGTVLLLYWIPTIYLHSTPIAGNSKLNNKLPPCSVPDAAPVSSSYRTAQSSASALRVAIATLHDTNKQGEKK
jgi:hypothetical protein